MKLGIKDKNTFIDTRDGKIYKTIKIGTQIWMAQNLAYKPPNGNYWAYNDDMDNVAKYGYLYDWETARHICPKGWHLPNNSEWKTLLDYASSINKERVDLIKTDKTQNKSLKDIVIKKTGFSALPSGYYCPDGTFNNIGFTGNWWSSTEDSNSTAYYWVWFLCIDNLRKEYDYKSYGYSVRCIKDEEKQKTNGN